MYWQGDLSLELWDIPAEKAVIYALEAETNRY
jgi:beta-fructofuranosidase